jgi:hypothetical protein
MKRGFLLLFIIGFAFISLQGESLSRDSSPEKASGPGPGQKSEGKVEGNNPPVQAKEAYEKPYTALVEKNIFSPERKEFPLPIQTSTVPAKKPQTRPQVVLYGVTLAGEYQSASIAQIGKPLRKGERELSTLKVGEKIGEYELKKILPDRISLESEGDSFEVLLYDAAKPKARTVVRTESKPATVTSTLPGPTPVDPSRPGVPGTPMPEAPRPTVPSPALGQERVGIPPLPTPGAPPAINPSPAPSPQPATPSPVIPPRRRTPVTPGIPSPEMTAPQAVPRESEGSI